MSEAPAEMWLRKGREGRYHETHYDDEPEVVRYVRADLYDAALGLTERRVEALLARRKRGEDILTEPWTLRELAVLEAAARALPKARAGRRFDLETFEAVAEAELRRLETTLEADYPR